MAVLMRWRVLIWLLLSGTLGLLVWCRFSSERTSVQSKNSGSSSPSIAPGSPASVEIPPLAAKSKSSLQSRFGYRVCNTTRSLNELIRDPRAILLENAFLDTSLALNPSLPANLRSKGDPGSYVVQSKGELNDSFRQTLSSVGARLVAYIPNNAYLVRMQADVAARLASDPQVSAVVPYEPYYKIKPSLLELLLNDEAFAEGQHGAAGSELSVRALLFDDGRSDTLAQLKESGIDVMAQDASPFGTVADLRCSSGKLAWIARLPGVQELELTRSRVPANDLSRASLGVASNSVTPFNYLGLTGSNVTVNVNDSGVDSNHPDLAGRVLWDAAASGVDSNGHGTHVAGIIAGSGGKSLTVTNASGSSIPPAALQFRGLAPGANIFSISVDGHSSPSATDTYLQQTAARSAALISNNSWHYANDPEYDLGAASYDAAVRDALPGVPDSQPLLCVFAAGNSGAGADDGRGGVPDSIQSPGTAKNVITVGAIEQARFITNQTWTCSSNGVSVTCQTNTPWLGLTDSSNQVASFSSRGNVGIGIEGASGRFKPDVVAPGTFVISTRSTEWDQSSYYSLSNNFFNIAPDANYEQVLSNLNLGLGPFYRFESGTSIGAAEVSGTLALIQEFFQQRLVRTNSPALMKALLINGARSLGGGYDFHTAGSTNSQGWGLVRLPNSLPPVLTNMAAPSSSMLLFDQRPAEALATGQQRTRFVSLTPNAQKLPLRVTLVWTDPPGNPVAGLKLVNNLDLVVTNLQTGDVFLGNDIPAGSDFNSAWQPGSSPNSDIVNNVENVYLAPPLGSNYSVTVLGRTIGVNAVTEHPDNVVQDYALVVSSGDGQLTNALTLVNGFLGSTHLPLVTHITNSIPGGGTESGAILLQQRVGANASLLGTNTIALPGLINALLTIGTLNPWHFYVFTNNTSFTNAVFLTFLTQPLSPVPGGDRPLASATPGQIWTTSADLDLYVSRDPGLTNLNPAVLAAADMSLGRRGAEIIIYSNATPGVYYVGVKCESLQGAEYGLVADVSQQPFAQIDSQGNELLRGFPQPAVVPSGTSSQPGEAYTFFLSPDSFSVRRAIISNSIACSSFGDLETTITHNSSTVVLENHSTNASSPLRTFVYDDSDEGDLPGALPSAGPASLRQFSGQDAHGLWLMTTITTNHPATNVTSWIFAERQQDLFGGIAATILPGFCRQDFIFVPAPATNLTAIATVGSATGPVSLEVYPAGGSSSNCASLVIDGAGAMGIISVDQTSHPPLNPGLYVIRACNIATNPVDIMIQASIVFAPSPQPPLLHISAGQTVIPDDAVCSSVLMVTNTDRILSAEVGVRIDHPRVSDLVLSLVAPDGTRVLLDAGRGGPSAAGLGATLIVTNSTPVSFSGGPVAVTNTFDTGGTSGTIVINYDFFALPDDMRLYYETNLLYDSGLVSFKGSTNINYGPGASTSFTIVMNQDGNSESNTAWFYSVATTRRKPLYLTFTENTNLTITPIKFAPPPFTNFTSAPGGALPGSGIFYLPEESLDKLVGKSAYGQWALEIWDNRAGATNPQPTLLSWQLALELASSISLPIPLVHSQPFTNLIGPGQIQAYEVDVPDWVSFSTNSLLGATAPVNLLFSSNGPPTGTNTGEVVLGRGSTSGSWTLRTNASPGLVPGSRYFLGVQNTNSTTVAVGFLVDFDVDSVITLTAGVPYANTNSGPFNDSDFYRYVVSLNAVRVQFEVNGPTSDVTLLARKGPPLPNLGSYDFISANPGTNDEVIVIYDYSRPVPLAGEWFLSVVDVTGSPAAYSILATEFQDSGTNIVLLDPIVTSNALCFSWNSLPGINYVFQGKEVVTDTNWETLSPTLTASDYTTTFCLPLPSPFQYFRVSEGLALVPVIPIISSVAYATNGTLLQWTGTTNSTFSVQWTRSLAAPNWHSFASSVTSTNGVFSFTDDGSKTGGLDTQRFYRLRQLR
jgi:subtilisin family serine protease/subtilisin-like proprotein convertase family protein